MEKPRIGYVGIGLMGLPMTLRLIQLGYSVTVFDIASERTDLACASGAKLAATPAQVVDENDIILLNLPTTDAVEMAVFGENGVATAIRPPQVIVDFSTVKVDKGRAFSAKLRDKTGCEWIDAPVSGGTPACAAGNLTIMAGGDDQPTDCGLHSRCHGRSCCSRRSRWHRRCAHT